MRIVVGDELDIGHPAQKALQRDPGLHAREVKPQTGVLAGREGDVRYVLPEDVEFL